MKHTHIYYYGLTIVFNSSGELETKATDSSESNFAVHDGIPVFHLSETTIGKTTITTSTYMYLKYCATDSLTIDTEIVSMSFYTPIITTSIVLSEGIKYKTETKHGKSISSCNGNAWSVPTFTSKNTRFNGESIAINHLTYSFQTSGSGTGI